jgi:RNA polymerase sigma-70 factor (ECF subfamily)
MTRRLADGQRSDGFATSKEQSARLDAELITRCRAGDLGAFEEIYRLHSGRLYNVVARMVGANEADDLVQDTFLQAYRKLGGFRGDSTLATWLYRLAVNLCLDRLRSGEAKVSRKAESFEEDEPAPAPRRTTELVVTRLDLERGLEALPPSYRAAFVLHDVEGFEHREVAAILGIAEGSSKSLVHKARLRLRTLLTR